MIVITQGPRGGAIKRSTQGSCEIDTTETSFFVDNWEGQGESYKRRDKALITFKFRDFEWQGTFEELYNNLNSK